VALDASNGAELWRGATGSEVVEQPAVAGGVVFTASSTGFDPSTGSLRGFDAAGCGSSTCTPLWSTETGSRITGAPAISAGTLFVGTRDGRLLAYRPAG
jgi:outer membrane protein assembly factor BamB